MREGWDDGGREGVMEGGREDGKHSESTQKRTAIPTVHESMGVQEYGYVTVQ